MNLLIKLMPLLLLLGICAPSYAAVSGVESISCTVYSASEENGEEKAGDDKKTDEDKKTGDVEPDCE